MKVVRLGRNTQVSKEMKIELKLISARIHGKSGVRKGLGYYIGSDYSDGDDLEANDGFSGDLIVINVERTAVVYMNNYTLLSILYPIKITVNK